MEETMLFEKIQCTVRLNQKGNSTLTEIVKSGPDAITIPEAAILKMQHRTGDSEFDVTGADCPIRNAQVVGKVIRGKGEELQRLSEIYGPDVVRFLFPTHNHVPTKLEELDLPAECMAPLKKTGRAVKPVDMGAAMKKALKGAGIALPEGDLSEDDLEALMAENGLTLEAA
jgi:hypothetical protein